MYRADNVEYCFPCCIYIFDPVLLRRMNLELDLKESVYMHGRISSFIIDGSSSCHSDCTQTPGTRVLTDVIAVLLTYVIRE